MRLDKWLKVACLFKKRALAKEACVKGRVRLNDRQVGPDRSVNDRDVITIRFSHGIRKVQALDTAKKSVSAKLAPVIFYRELPLSSEEETEDRRIRSIRMAARTTKYEQGGRPTKKDRRKIMQVKRQNTQVTEKFP
jgi:ribosome-associated heat shock protein Hsp15